MNTTSTFASLMSRSITLLRAALVILCVALLSPSSVQAQVPANEADYYKIVTLPIPEGVVLEVGGMDVLPDGQLAVSTRRGEVWLVKNPSMIGPARPEFKRFAHGMHEALGLAYRDGMIYTSQRGELTRLKDRPRDKEACSGTLCLAYRSGPRPRRRREGSRAPSGEGG